MHLRLASIWGFAESGMHVIVLTAMIDNLTIDDLVTIVMGIVENLHEDLDHLLVEEKDLPRVEEMIHRHLAAEMTRHHPEDVMIHRRPEDVRTHRLPEDVRTHHRPEDVKIRHHLEDAKTRATDSKNIFLNAKSIISITVQNSN